MEKYEYAEAKCQIENQRGLTLYRQLRSKWLTALQTMSPNGIRKQLTHMVWNEAIWRTHNEARRIYDELPDPKTIGFNNELSNLLDEGYVALQCLAIRRQLDKGKDVYSLKRLLLDLEANRHLITREIYVAYDGLPYDPEPARQKYFDKVFAESKKTGKAVSSWLETKGPDAWSAANRVHEAFDKLSGVKPDNRKRNDLIRPEVFARLSRKMNICNSVEQTASAFFAHAINNEKIEDQGSKESLHLRRILVCQRALCQIANYIDGLILWNSSGTHFPIAQFQILKDIDKPMVDSSKVPELRAFFEKHSDMVEGWSRSNWSESI